MVSFQSFSPAQWDPYCIPKGWELGKAGTGTDTIWGEGHLPILSPPNGWMAGGRSPPLVKDFWRRCTDVERCTGGSILGRSNRGSLCFSCALFYHLFLHFLISSQSHCELHLHSHVTSPHHPESPPPKCKLYLGSSV